MQNIKLHEATKNFKLKNKVAMFFLEKNNVPVKSHSSSINMEQLELLRDFAENQDKYKGLIAEFKKAEKEKKNKTAKKEEPKEVITEEKTVKKAPEKKEVAKKDVTVKAPEKKETKIKPAEPVKKTSPAPKQESKPAPEPEPKQKAEPVSKPAPKPAPKPSPKPAPKQKTEPVSKPAPKPAQRPAPAKPERRPEPPKRHTQQRPDNRRNMYGRNKQQRPAPKPRPDIKKKPVIENYPEMISISDLITIKELAEKLNAKLKHFTEKTEAMGYNFLPNQFIPVEDVKKICESVNVEVIVTDYEDYLFTTYVEKKNVTQIRRAPVVTVMGHVDHGKTTLLDTLRKTRVAAREAGGITQSIGAYKINKNGNDIIFIDTPGHEAFTKIRARGAEITDIVILVVAANDGVKPQTIEAINHAKSAGVPMIVAINKIDLPSADPNKVKQDLTQQGIIVEDWGGDVVSVEISAKNGENLDALLEMVTLVAEMQELNCYEKAPARGTVLESRLDTKLGPIATVLIQDGTMKTGDKFICGNSTGKVKSIFNDHGKTAKKSVAPEPVELMGFDNVPDSGDRFQIIDDLEKAKKIIDMRLLKDKEEKSREINAEKKMSLSTLFQKMEPMQVKEFPIILKTDNYGSSEVLEEVLLKKDYEKIKIKIVHKGIGNINESDILLASTSNAVIFGFNVKTPQRILALAKREQIEIKLYNVIYHLMEDLDKAVKGEIEPEYVEKHIGSVEVLQKFKISKIGIIAGCLVKEGKITNKSRLKVIRNQDLVFEGEIETLRRIKDQVTEVKAGVECGVKIKNFNAIEINDMLEVYELTLKK